jgi:hypothetical protein
MAITFEINAALGIPQDLDWFEFQKLAYIFHSRSICSDTLENFLESYCLFTFYLVVTSLFKVIRICRIDQQEENVLIFLEDFFSDTKPF